MSIFKQPLIQNPPPNLKCRDNKPAEYDNDDDDFDENDDNNGDNDGSGDD